MTESRDGGVRTYSCCEVVLILCLRIETMVRGFGSPGSDLDVDFIEIKRNFTMLATRAEKTQGGGRKTGTQGERGLVGSNRMPAQSGCVIS